MGQWALSPSQLARPRRLADRLATEVRTEIREEAKKGGEATVSSMAERFAPEGQKGLAAGAGEPLIEPTVILQRAAEARRAPFVNRWVIAALTRRRAGSGGLAPHDSVAGRRKPPYAEQRPVAEDDAQPPASQQAAVAAAPAIPKTTRDRARHRPDRSGQAGGQGWRGGRLRRDPRHRRGAAGAERRRHPRHARRRDLLARPSLRR